MSLKCLAPLLLSNLFDQVQFCYSMLIKNLSLLINLKCINLYPAFNWFNASMTENQKHQNYSKPFNRFSFLVL